MTQKPFYGLLPPPPSQPASSKQPSRPRPYGANSLRCAYCDHEIEVNETAVDVLIGFVGAGPKSGRAMVLPGDDLADLEENQASLHLECCIQWMDERMGGGLFPFLCESCGEVMEGDR